MSFDISKRGFSNMDAGWRAERVSSKTVGNRFGVDIVKTKNQKVAGIEFALRL